MAIPESDPRAQDLDAAFEAAMNGPAKPRAEATAPPELDRDAPHGRADDGTPLAPWGHTKDGKPKLTKGGRPRKDDPNRPRTATVTELHPPQDDRPPAGKPLPHDWSEELDGFADAVWFGLSAVGKLGPSVPLLGKLIPEQKLAAQAYLLSEVKPQLVGAVNLAAQHNAKAARFCQKLEGGDGLWALTCMFMVMPVVSISATIWRGDAKALAEAELPSLADMASMNGGKMDDTLKRIQLQIAAQAEAAQAAVQQSEPEMPAAG